MSRPNILLITTDQQRKDTLGCYGNDLIKTPNIDRLANEGMVFNDAYCESPICLPCRNTMVTGKVARHHGVTLHGCSMRDDERTVAHALSEAGYSTHLIGKAHFKTQHAPVSEESGARWRNGEYANWNGPYAGFESVDFILGTSNALIGHYGEWMKKEHPENLHYFKSTELERLDVRSRAHINATITNGLLRTLPMYFVWTRKAKYKVLAVNIVC